MYNVEDFAIGNQLSAFIDDVVEVLQDGKEVIRTGFDALDHQVDMEKGCNTYIMLDMNDRELRSGFLTSLFVNLARKKRHVLYYSPRESSFCIYRRLLAHLIYPDRDYMKVTDPTAEEIDDMTRASEILYDSGCYVIDNRKLSIEEFIEIASELIEEHDCEAVIIDGVDEIDYKEEMDYVHSRLKSLEVPVIGAMAIPHERSIDEAIDNCSVSLANRPDYFLFMEDHEDGQDHDMPEELHDVDLLVVDSDRIVRRNRMMYFTRNLHFCDYCEDIRLGFVDPLL